MSHGDRFLDSFYESQTESSGPSQSDLNLKCQIGFIGKTGEGAEAGYATEPNAAYEVKMVL